MKNILKFSSVHVIIFVLGMAAVSMATSFSADIVTEKRGKTLSGKIFVTDASYRWQTVEDGKPVVILVDRKGNVHTVMDMERKNYFRMPSNDFRVLMQDPLAASTYNDSKYGSQVEGAETVNGVKCEKQVIVLQGTRVQARWFSHEMNFPVKIISYQGKHTVVTELKNIRKATFDAAYFRPPTDFKPIKDPSAGTPTKQEEPVAALTAAKTVSVPCYVRIGAGGELRVPVDTDRRVFLDVTGDSENGSTYSVLQYRDGKPRQGFQAQPDKVKKRSYPKSYGYNDDFARKTGTSLVDELRIRVETGTIYARVMQKGDNRTDIYNPGGTQMDLNVDPKRPVTLNITADNPRGGPTSGTFALQTEAARTLDKITFTVDNGKTLTWDYGADKRISLVAITISRGKGAAKIAALQPVEPTAATPAAGPRPTTMAQKPPQRINQPKPVTEFTVTYPRGRGGPIITGKDLVVTVTAISGNASGQILFYPDRTKKVTAGDFKFKLDGTRSKSFSLPAEKNAGWYVVWVHKGSFKVVLNQSPSAKAPEAGQASPAPAAPQPSGHQKDKVASGEILNSRVPLMTGARVIKTIGTGTVSRVDMEVPATPAEVVSFYREAMTADGWKPGLSMVKGAMGALQMVKGGERFTLKAKSQGEGSVVHMVIQSQ